MRPLNELELWMLRKAGAGADIRGSDRADDKAKQFLRREGYLEFAGKPKRWVVTAAGKELAAVWQGEHLPSLGEARRRAAETSERAARRAKREAAE